MTSCCQQHPMPWSGATGAIARGKRVSTGCGRKRRSVRALHWICGVKPKPKAVNKPLQHSIVHGLAKPGVFTTVSKLSDVISPQRAGTWPLAGREGAAGGGAGRTTGASSTGSSSHNPRLDGQRRRLYQRRRVPLLEFWQDVRDKALQIALGLVILKCCSNFGAIPIIDNKTIGCEPKEAEKPDIAGPGS